TVEASGITAAATATLTSIPENLRVSVRLNNINNTGLNVVTAVGFLAGDVDASRSVTASDILRIKGRAGPVNASSYRHDVDASGIIDGGDVSAAKARARLARLSVVPALRKGLAIRTLQSQRWPGTQSSPRKPASQFANL